ncbi:MAG TPA: acyl-CoA synthetase FdrA [Elusimicrobiota bacterium]|nr:acyl-CoA synthetase FdrA [Elusimicrobiota bacterium]
MPLLSQLKKDTYFDSVTLMLATNELKKIRGVHQAVIGMGTDYNLESLKRLGLLSPELADATPSDLILAVDAATEEAAVMTLREAERLLSVKKGAASGTADYAPATQAGAAKALPGANIVLISVPGDYAASEARRALDSGRHVMLFSDNVSIDDELELKTRAVEKNLLMMGPDCGTAILNGVPLAFANAVRKGDIGVVAASGTGLQEVTSLIHRMGCGVSQAIGVGGRDLSEKIGGIMTLQAVRALEDDRQTKVIVLLSKPPAEKTFHALLGVLKDVKKPVVIYFIGADPVPIERLGFAAAQNLEDAARTACRLSTGRQPSPLLSDEEIAEKASKVRLTAPSLRALYSGGTLCDEAQRILLPRLKTIHSNTPVAGCEKLPNVYQSRGHTILDLGDDEFTRGRAHPMIDPSFRQEKILSEYADPETGMLVVDVVLGYGSHPDMAGAVVRSIEEARERSPRPVVLAATLCGTEDDPQDYEKQRRTLEDAGVFVFPSNVSMVKFIVSVMSHG